MGLFHSAQGFFIVTILIDLNLSACVIEVCQAFERFGLLVEANDGLHDLGVVVPVLVLEEVPRQNIDLGLSRILSKANYLLYISALQKATHALELFVRRGVELCA